MKVAIVGAGIAGLACADRLTACGQQVAIFDKGKRPGGRASTLTLEDKAWDFGAQYFTSRSPAFRDTVARWTMAGHVAPWPQAGDDALVGMPGMSAILAAEAARHDVRFNALVQAIGRVGRSWHLIGPGMTEGPFDAVVIAVPAEQAATLIGLHDLNMAKEAATVRSVPSWTLMLAFAEPLDGVADVIRPTGAIAWAARNSSKAGRPATECWVIQAEAEWSARNLERDAADVAPDLLTHFAELVGRPLPQPIFQKAHRWRFALPRGGHGAPIWNGLLGLGACGDWCSAPRIEAAWLSGQQLADRILASTQKQAVSAPSQAA